MSATKCAFLNVKQHSKHLSKQKQEDFNDFQALLYKFNDFQVLTHMQLSFLLCNFVHERQFNMLDILEKFLKYEKRKYEKREMAIYTRSIKNQIQIKES